MGEISNLMVVAMGIGIVFLGLVCIVFICSIMSAIVRKLEGKAPAVEVPKAVETAPKAQIENRGELIAAIAAVLAEELGTDVKGLRIVSLKKIS